MAESKGTRQDVLLRLTSDTKHKYTVGVLATELGRARVTVQDAVRLLAKYKSVRQYRYRHGDQEGFCYAHPDTPEDAPVLVVAMVPRVITVENGTKNAPAKASELAAWLR